MKELRPSYIVISSALTVVRGGGYENNFSYRSIPNSASLLLRIEYWESNDIIHFAMFISTYCLLKEYYPREAAGQTEIENPIILMVQIQYAFLQ